MSALAGVHVALAAVYAYVAVSYGMVRLRRGARPFHGLLALGSLVLAIWALSTVAWIEADDVGGAELALRGELLAHLLGIAVTVEFVQIYRAGWTSPDTSEGRGWGRALQALCAALGVLALAGAFFDGTAALPPGSGGWPVPVVGIQPAPRPAAFLLALPLLGIGAISVGALLRGGSVVPLVPYLLAASVSFVALAHDVAVAFLHPGALHLTALAALVPVLYVAVSLVRLYALEARELRLRTAELSEAVDDLQRTRRELLRSEQLAALAGLSAAIAHEVKNPLAVMQNATSSLRRGGLGPEDRGTLLAILREEVERLQRLDRDLLEFARPPRPEQDVIDVRALLEDAVEPFRQAAGPSLRLDVPAGLARVRADRGLLRQALTRLLDNAVRAARSEIRVEARQEGEADGAVLSVTVVDDGEGMDAKELSRAIDPFFTTRPSGIGLGLSIVDRVARHHGGALELESAKGEGTRVRVEVPAVPLEAPP